MKQILLVFLALVSISIQEVSALLNISEKGNDKTTLYCYGKPLTTCESNFENLFANVPKYIENGKDIQFLSCKYVGIVKDGKQAYQLVKKNFKDYPLWSIDQSYAVQDTSIESSKVILCSTPPNEVRLFANTSIVKEMIKTMAYEYIRPGDKIYLLRFVFNKRTIEQHVFIHAGSKEVVNQYDVFGFDIPLSHFDFINRIDKKLKDSSSN